MARPISVFAVVMLFLGPAVANGDEGRLQQVRNNANSSASSTNDNIFGSFLGALSSSSDDGDIILGAIVTVAVVLAPYYIPPLVLGDAYQNRMYFANHPYSQNYYGYQLLSTDLSSMNYEGDTLDVPRQSWAVRLSVENGNDFAGVNRVGGQLRLEHACRLGVITNWNYFQENGNGRTDETLVSDTNLIFRFAQNESASFYSGLGFRTLTDRQQSNYGFNFTYGGDWFPVRPLIVSGNIDLGTLGSASVVHARGSVGAIYHGVEMFVGYDFLRIGTTNIQGPMAGVRFWF